MGASSWMTHFFAGLTPSVPMGEPSTRARFPGRPFALAGLTVAAALLAALVPVRAEAKSLIDYFRPMPIVSELTSNAWGASGVLPRDQDNGLEDRTMKSWAYWDGKIMKAADGTFHLFASRWDQAAGHNGWFGSQCVHAVSPNGLIGPYVPQGNCYTDNPAGHNVTAGQFADGTYAILISETRRPATFYTARSLDGPFRQLGGLRFDANGFSNVDLGGLSSNTTMVVRPDGAILMVARAGITFLGSASNPLGPYKVQSNVSVMVQGGINDNGDAEDPCIWYSGGNYHAIINYWDKKKAYHFMSKDGAHDWKNMGLAYDPTKDFLRYTDGTVNRWAKLERPSVYLEDGHVVAFTFAGIDVEKDNDRGNDSHGSKIIVVPFDGRAFDREISGEIDDGADDARPDGGVDAGPDGEVHDGGDSLPRDGGPIAEADAGSAGDGGAGGGFPGDGRDGGAGSDGEENRNDGGGGAKVDSVVGGACQSGPGPAPWPLWMLVIAAWATRAGRRTLRRPRPSDSPEGSLSRRRSRLARRLATTPTAW